ncbi:MAG: nucleoside hydrolase, partial [Rhodanobacter sp.]
MTRPQLLIDTDPGVDDALAILMAYAHADIAGLSIAAGNVGLGHTVRNACTLVDLVGMSTPVFAGCATPLVRAPEEDAAFVHGEDGFGDVGFAEPAAVVSAESAALALLRLTRERPGELTLVALGPLTNLALALRLDPSLPDRVARLVVMGGAVTGHGNTGKVPAEFNIGFDPEAAHVVFEAFPAFDLVDWEATLRHAFDNAEFDGWLAA